MRPRFLQQGLITIFCVICKVSPGFAALSDKHVDELLKQAETLQLAQHETWFSLLHYKRETLSFQFISQADDSNFFLAENGKTDANAELIANIKAFSKGPRLGHAQCRFPARWWWLKQQLDFQEKNEVRCPKLETFMLRISQDKLYLVFPTMYLNNPGSTFGHTFLRFDSDDNSILLSQTLNYAARVNKTDDLLTYVGKGLFGGYQGFFKARPYYETVQEYNNIENRDIWEYQLDYSKQEIAQLARHVWEIKGIDFDYYFFRENCAYRLLALLDVMRPGVQLTGEGRFPVYAIPVDTVRVLDEEKLITARNFRASLSTQIEEDFIIESSDISSVVINIISDETLSESNEIGKKLKVLKSDKDKLQALDRSFDVLQFHGKSASAKALAILDLTNGFSSTANVEIKPAKKLKRIPPEKGHESVRVTAGYGEQNDRHYIDLQFRSAFHDLIDAPQGYIDGASINSFDFRFKGFVNNGDVIGDGSDEFRLESLSFINVTSFNPVKQWITPVSWLFDIRLDRTQLSETKSARNFISRGGAGYSFKFKSLKPFALIMAEANIASSYDDDYSILLGVQAGFYLTLKSNQLMMSYQADEAVSGFELDRQITQLQWQYNLQVNHAVRLSYKRIEYDFFDDEDWSLSYKYYF